MKINIMLLATIVLALTSCKPTPTGDSNSSEGVQEVSSPTPVVSPTPTPTPPTATPTPVPTPVALKIHSENPRYFQETNTGKAVLVAAFTSLVPTDRSFDYAAQIREMQNRGIKYTRVWHFLPWAGVNAIWPWARSNTDGAPMGGKKLDMNVWNNEYWTRMRDGLQRATDAGITAEIHLFDRCGMSPAGSDRWKGNPWASDNNINKLETPKANSDGTPEFYMIANRPTLRKFQEAYIKKMIDETIQYNVIYEIENEHWEDDTIDWAKANADFVKNYITNNYPDKKRLVSYNSLENDIEQAFGVNTIDIVNKHFGNEAENDITMLNTYIEARWGFAKPINIDEFANGVTDPTLLRKMGWSIVTSGGHFHIEDASLDAKPFELVENIHAFLKESGWQFIYGRPNRTFSSSGYCMVQGNTEVVCYYRNGGTKSFSLGAGSYQLKWWNTKTGGFTGAQTITHGGGSLSVNSPDASDWVLYVKSTMVGPSPTPPPAGQCLPTPPVLNAMNPKIHNRPRPGKIVLDVTPIVCSGPPGSSTEGYCEFVMNDPFRRCCPIRPEGDPLREVCEAERTGKDPSDGRVGPSWSIQGPGSIQKNSNNPYLLFVFGNGTVTACSNVPPIVCGTIEITDNNE